MTCTSCAARIEKRLNRLDGVQASVNFATERATVELPDGTSVEQAIAAVEETGYAARIHDPAPVPGPVVTTDATEADAPREADPLFRRL
ncbi:MAG: heavy-metal-associated domain-containing protein, partial [Cellulomonas sp.]|nr:heavy-metal-associated domain-containing protein [Cellulomonas sp.]